MSAESKTSAVSGYQHDLVRTLVDASSQKFLEDEFVTPKYWSFAHFLAMSQERDQDAPDWIGAPECPTNLLDLVNSDSYEPEGKHQWLYKPNAGDESELLRACNDNRVTQSNVTAKLGGTIVERGQLKFLQNDTNYEVRLEGRYRYLSPNVSFLPGTYDVTTPYIKKGSITIAIIPPGSIGIALLDNEPICLLPGRHAYNNPLFLFTANDVFDINEALIHLHTITILNIKENQVGIVNVDNKYVLLTPGLHLANNPSFSHDVTLNILGPHSPRLVTIAAGNMSLPSEGSTFKLGTITLARVRPSEYGCAFVDNIPKLLYPGFYVENSPSFSFRRVILSNLEHISFGPLNVLNVAKGQIAKVVDDNRPMLIEGPGVVMKNSTLFNFVGMELATKAKIVHGSITRYRIPTGNIGFGRRKGIVEKLSPGIRVVDDPDFVFIKDVPAHSEIIQEGHYSLITTREGRVRPVWVNGVLEILHEGFKQYETPNIVVGTAIALSPPILDFRKIEAYTRDRSQMLISGQVEYEVQNPKQLVTTIGADKLVESLEKRVDAILRHSLAITDLSSISPEAERPVDSEMDNLRRGLNVKREEHEEGGISMYQPQPISAKAKDEDRSDFTDQLSKEATKELSTDAARWGVKVIKVEVSDIHYKDEKVERAISERTTQTRIAESDYDLTLVKNRQEIVETEAKAQQEYILTESKTKKALLEQRTKATNEDIENDISLAKKKALVEADAIEVQGKAEAEAAKVLEAARAEARAIEIRAEAKLLATRKEAEGKLKLLEVEHKRYGGPEALLELELMALEVEMAEAAANAKVPTVSMNTSQASEGSLLAMLRNQGTGLFRLATAASQESTKAAEQKALATSPKGKSK
eukprot:gb/GEZN01001333.1/.p1 GENE.gb/GEZN01001333.1/~~gb/GEZN01001333.1/.p1  ORF type:complete len:869 (+),score=160.14 gb/GEZN01001333.1/:235-2841(+)